MAEGGTSDLLSTRRKRTLECSICLERFCNPKTLPCLHSFCEDCLINYAPRGTKTLNCPLCKEQTTIPDGDASNFKSNFHLNELVDEIKLTEQITQTPTEILCNCCDEDLVAVSKCMDCNQYLCSTCLKAHKRFPALRDHFIATFVEIKAGKVRPRSNPKRHLMCIKHPSNKAEIFCTTCETPICHVCSSLRHKYPEHECIETAEAVATMRKQALESLDKLSLVGARFRQAAITAEEGIVKSSSRANTIKANIEAKCKLLVDKIESDKASLFEVVNLAVAEDKEKLEQNMTSAESFVSNVESTLQEVKYIAEDANDGDFVSLYGTIKCKLDQMRLKKPEVDEYASSADRLLFVKRINPDRFEYLGYIMTSKTMQTELVSEYKGQSELAHDFFGIDMGFCSRFQQTQNTQIFAVTDRKSNEVIILDASLLEKQRLNINSTDKEHPVCDVALSFYKTTCYLYVVDQSARVEILRMDSTHKFLRQGQTATDTKVYDGCTVKDIPSSIAVDSENNIIVGKTETPCHHLLVRVKLDSRDNVIYSGSVSDSLRISQTPCFLAFNSDETHMIVSDTYAGTVTILENYKAGAVKSVLDTNAAGQNAPTGICCDSSGCIYVAALLHCRAKVRSSIHKYTSTGCHMAWLGDFDHPIYGIVFTSERKLAAACGDTVKLFDVQDA